MGIPSAGHELKVPLRAGQILLLLVAADKTTIGEKAQAAVQMAERNCHRLQLMVSELLDFEIMSSGNVRLTKGTSGSGQIMQAAADMVRAIASDQNIEVVLKDCQTDSQVDPDRMIRNHTQQFSSACINFHQAQTYATSFSYDYAFDAAEPVGISYFGQ